MHAYIISHLSQIREFWAFLNKTGFGSVLVLMDMALLKWHQPEVNWVAPSANCHANWPLPCWKRTYMACITPKQTWVFCAFSLICSPAPQAMTELPIHQLVGLKQLSSTKSVRKLANHFFLLILLILLLREIASYHGFGFHSVSSSGNH